MRAAFSPDAARNPPKRAVMKIIVAVKQVPVRDSVIRVDSTGKWIEEQDLSLEIPIVKELADALGAGFAASRPICDNGWLPMELVPSLTAAVKKAKGT